jgi:hypothetical protein
VIQHLYVQKLSGLNDFVGQYLIRLAGFEARRGMVMSKDKQYFELFNEVDLVFIPYCSRVHRSSLLMK